MNRYVSHPPSKDRPWQLAELVALGVLLTFAWRACGARHKHRRLSRSARAPLEVQAWEGEGGRPLPAEHLSSTAALATTAPKR